MQHDHQMMMMYKKNIENVFKSHQSSLLKNKNYIAIHIVFESFSSPDSLLSRIDSSAESE